MRKLKIAYLGSGPISNFHIPALKKVGFKVERLQGPPGKREMLRGVK